MFPRGLESVRSRRTGSTGTLQFANERAIAIARLPLSVGALIATYFEPEQPEQATACYTLLFMYLAFAVLLLITQGKPHSKLWYVATHAVELMLLCGVITLTEGPTSPFFIYFSFVVLAAALRWQARGALITGGALSMILMVMTWVAFIVRLNDADIQDLIVRNVYLIVVSVLFAFLGHQFYVSSQQEQRLKLAQDLHDGLLQNLAAIRLRLYTAVQKLGDAERPLLSQAAQLLGDEQQRLREFVSESRGFVRVKRDPVSPYSLEELKDLLADLQRLWGCQIDLAFRPANAQLPRDLATALQPVWSEAVANAVLHGRAKRVEALVSVEENCVRVKLSDNGGGLDLDGDFSHDELFSRGIGPRSIRERIEKLGGELRLSSSASGVTLSFVLPVEREA